MTIIRKILIHSLLALTFATSVSAQTYSAQLESLAQSGDVDAQLKVADYYYNGNGVSKDYNKAVQYYQMAASQNSPQAQGALGDCYLKGTGVSQNIQTGLYWMQKAADNNYAPAQHCLGCYYLSGTYLQRDYSLAKKWFEKAAAQNCSLAEHNLGFMYDKWLIGGDILNPFDQKPQKELAVKYYLRAAQHGCVITIQKIIPTLAEKGNAEAIRILGRCYEFGTALPKDEAKAIELYKQAIEKGDDIAIVYLSAYYNNHKQYEEAFSLFQMYEKKHKDDAVSSELYQLACFKLGHYYLNGLGVTKDIQKAIPYLEIASRLGYDMASLELGQCYTDGIGVTTNIYKAIDYLNLSVKQGNGNKVTDLSLRQLASIYGFGKNIEKDTEKAYLLIESVNDKDDYTHLLTGEILYSDTKTTNHYQKAIDSFSSARKSNNEQISGVACFYLSKCYRFGYGCAKDTTKAEELWQEAIDKGCKDASDIEKMRKDIMSKLF